jgi:hypothetical protein
MYNTKIYVYMHRVYDAYWLTMHWKVSFWQAMNVGRVTDYDLFLFLNELKSYIWICRIDNIRLEGDLFDSELILITLLNRTFVCQKTINKQIYRQTNSFRQSYNHVLYWVEKLCILISADYIVIKIFKTVFTKQWLTTVYSPLCYVTCSFNFPLTSYMWYAFYITHWLPHL